MIDYNAASKSYDNTRSASEHLVARFDDVIHFSTMTAVLDFGCGTGNYLNLIKAIYGCKCYGVEPSTGMRARAKEKNPRLIIEEGDHSKIPFSNSFFDFIYMTDVIHHVPDLRLMFITLKEALKPTGKLCIITESHAQIKGRFYNRYFPSLSENEMRRYPDVAKIISCAKSADFTLVSLDVREAPASSVVSASLVKTVEEKNFSMFRLLNDNEYASGLEKLKKDLGTVYENRGAGDSLIWLERADAL
jgi:ubiquinone/menaquinone biosynthesis C-methylase UbiE